MKNKIIICCLLVSMLVASCTPATTTAPTVIPTMTTAPTITPTLAPQNLADAPDLPIWIEEYVHAYGGKVTVNDVEMDSEQLTNAIRQNPEKFTQTKQIKGLEYSFVIVKGTPISMKESSFSWEKATFAKIARKLGLSVTTRINAGSELIVPEIATTLQMEYGDPYSIYNENFDWSKVTTNWDTIKQELIRGNIPFQDEIFDINSFGYKAVEYQIDYTKEHDLDYKGDCLFYPLFFFKHPVYASLPPEDQKKVVFFMAASKILKFQEISTANLSCELIAWELWGDSEKTEQKFQELGSTDFLVGLATLIKEVKPDIKLVIIEDLIIYNSPLYRNLFDDIYLEQYNQFFGLLGELKEKHAPIDGAMTENNMWIYSPPERQFIETTLQKIKDTGFEIAASETVVGIDDNHPVFSDNYIPREELYILPSGISPDQKQAEIFAMLLDAALNQGTTNFGFGSASDGTADMFDQNQEPKVAYFEVLKVLYKHIQ